MAEETKGKEALSLSETEFKEMRFKLYGGAALAAFNIFMAGAVLLSWGHEFDRYKKMSGEDGNPDFKKYNAKLLKVAKNDKDYVKAKTMYGAAAVNMLAGLLDVVQIGVQWATTAKSWAWAVRINRYMHNPLYFFPARMASGMLSLVGAIWDATEAMEYLEQGETELAAYYFVSAFLGFGCFAVIMAAAFWPVTLAVMALYALCSIFVAYKTPDKLETWLKKCYFGRERRTDSLSYSDWENEIRSFYKATGKAPSMSAAAT